MVVPGLTVEQLLDEVAAATPSPGGGACCGWAAALAAALIEMAAGVAEARGVGAEAGGDDASARGADVEAADRMSRIRLRANDLRRQATELAELDRDSYGPVLAAQRSGDAAAVQLALVRASDTPFALTAVAAELAVLAQEVLAAGRPSLEGDAMTALELARASCRAAASLVMLNLKSRPTDPRRKAVQALLGRAGGSAGA
jgi:formiminotetrahydrofolate cyclodeaminase